MPSPRARSVWAKSRDDDDHHGEVVEWLPLHQHLDDTADVAGLLWDEWVPTHLQRTLAAPLDGNRDAARTLLVYLAAVHDVGKASPAFAVQVPALADRMRAAGLPLNAALRDTDDRRIARHEVVGLFSVSEWLVAHGGLSRVAANRLASVVGAHHGASPRSDALAQAQHRDDLIGAGPWAGVREELLARAAERSGVASILPLLAANRVTQPGLVLLTGLVIMADWIASNDDYFPLFPVGEQPAVNQAARTDAGWAAADLPHRWQPGTPPDTVAQLFAERFDLPPGATPRGAQAALVAAARAADGPRLLVLEAGMGSGKTEAALAAAEIIAHASGAGGVFIALPTMATTDSMFARVLAWGERLTTGSSVFLAHSKSQLNPTFRRMTSRAFYRSLAVDAAVDAAAPGAHRRGIAEEVVAHRWLSDRKRGPLAHLVIGTIDQALFLALRSKHSMLRHLALAGKVVIIDEAHAYSIYSSAYLDRALHWLGAHGTSVIILSATLPAERRRRMAEAYETGQRLTRGQSALPPADATARYTALAGDIGYPAITVAGGVGPPAVIHPAPDPAPPVEVRLDALDDTPEQLVATLREALADGGCVAVIRNTVSRVQETARTLRTAFPDIDVVVAHSRFLAADRMRTDAELLDACGSPRRSTGRPRACIVVASQVIEQSLDLDFDLMITDLAPIDLLLQRSGRLHRHPRGVGQSERPAALREPRLVVTGVDWAAVPPEHDRSYAKIYHPHVLLRTLAELDGRTRLTLPDDIAPLVQRVYGGADYDLPGWGEAFAAAQTSFEREREAKEHEADGFRLAEVRATQSLRDWAPVGVGALNDDSQAVASVRGSGESLEVLVLTRNADGQYTTPPWLAEGGGLALPHNEPPPDALARVILGTALRLPESICRPREIDAHIEQLERQFDLPAWHRHRLLDGELVLVLDRVHRGDNSPYRATLGTHTLTYHHTTGLEIAYGPATRARG